MINRIPLSVRNLKTYCTNNTVFSFLLILFFFISSNSIGQGPGSLFVDAGPDIVIDCGATGCTDLTANFLETFETNSATYTISPIDYVPPFAFDGLANSLNPDIDDSWSNVDSLPFDFCFFGNLEQEFQVGSNGVIRFEVDPTDVGVGSNAWSFSENLPNSTSGALSEANVFTPVHDIDPTQSTTEEVGYEVLGSFPNRVLVVSYFEVPMFFGACNALLATHMAVFYEFSNVVEIYIQDKPSCPDWNSGNAALGIQNNAGTVAYVPPGRNTSDSPWTTNNEAWRFAPDGIETYVFEWLDASGTVIGTTPTINVCPPGGSGTYTARVTYTNNCNGDTVVLTDDVVVTSAINFAVDLGGDQQLCDQSSYDITAAITGTTNSAAYLWSTGDVTQSITVTESGTYSVDVTIDSCTLTETVVIDLDESPLIELGSDIQTCFELAVVLDASPSNIDPALAVYEWSLDGTILIGETQAIYAATQIGTYSVLVNGGICTSVDSIVISSSGLDLSLGPDITTCFEDSIILDASPSNFDPLLATYVWSLNGTLITGATEAILAPSEHGIYKVVVTAGSCTGTDTVAITPIELLVSLGNNFETCFDENVVLEAEVSNYNGAVATYAWSFNGSTIADETLPTLEITETGTYSVLVTGGGCNGSAQIVVRSRNDLGVALGDDYKSCRNEQQTISATTSETDVTYEWFLNGDPIAGESSADLSFEIATGTFGIQTYLVEIRKGDCTGTDSVDISLYDVGNCVVSQGISPNGDGMNDCLDLEYLVDKSGLFSIEIFNRFGTSVYSNGNYLNQWCGQTNDGSDLPTATYFYVIKFETSDPDIESVKTGWVYLNKNAN
ncbi:MAG: gliding motility-associated-like protein [Cyclobacteriaceae bacterium]|jgi:gliding motility-associated-like protein